MGIQPGSPHLHSFAANQFCTWASALANAVKLYYVGSTEGCTSSRESSRYRKFNQVVRDKLVSAELCLRYWARDLTFWQWVAVPISSAVPSNIIRGREQAMIQTLQPLHRSIFLSLLGGFAPKRASSGHPIPGQAHRFRSILRKRCRKLCCLHSPRVDCLCL